MVIHARYRRPDRSLTLQEAAEICLQCGVCCVVRGQSCHVTYDRAKFDPKYTYVYDCLGAADPSKNQNIWLCVSCHKCEEICPYEVSPIDFIEAMKPDAFELGHAHPVILGEVEQVLATSYAFPITPSTARLREELSLSPLQTTAARELEAIATSTGMAGKLRKVRGEPR